jgi:hypothetical protein
MDLKYFLAILISLFFFNAAYASSFTIICKGISSNAEVNNFIQDNPPYSHISFRFNNVTYEFENNGFTRNKNLSFFGAIAQQGESRIGYYVIAPSDPELAAPLLHGKIFIVFRENGEIIDSSEDNAICTIVNYSK